MKEMELFMEDNNIKIVSQCKEFSLPFYVRSKNIENDYDEYESFIKGCEIIIRNDDRYTYYLSKLKEEGLTKCAVLGNLPEGDKIKVEMHHGPLLTLFDICDIVVRYLLKTKCNDMTTFKVGDIILAEHEADNIQIVMLSKTPHKAVERNLFIHTKASFGRVDRFLEKYKDALTIEHIESIERYIKLCREFEGTIDNGLFSTGKKLKSFKV